MEEGRFHTMGTIAHIVSDLDGAVEEARTELERLEGLWTRFRPTSDISRLNRAGGRPCPVAPETATLIGHGCAAWELTDRLFDISVYDALIQAGYDRTFELLDPDLAPPAASGPDARAYEPIEPTRTPDDILVDRHAHTVRLPDGMHIDLGGIGKGRAADLVAERLRTAGGEHHVVNLGGDLRAHGGRPDGSPWRVAVTDPDHPTVTRCVLALRDGAVATSTSRQRRWSVDGESRHHLIDPRTGRPAESSLISVTVVSRETLLADVLAKAALIADQHDAFRLLRRFGAPALLVTEDGDWLATPELTPFIETDSATVVDATTVPPSPGAPHAAPVERIPA
jgi:thiamine biosynthesis lipoprotein